MEFTPENLAEKFCQELHEILTAEEVQEIVERNAENHDSMSCASHDFCDANVVMATAFQNLTGREILFDSDADILLWNDAWTIARNSNFNL